MITARSLVRRFIASLLLACSALAHAGVSPIEVVGFEDPEQEALYRQLIGELRCPQCLNTNLAGSDAPIAADLRATVERLIREGRDRDEIREWLRQRYGDFILYAPPMRGRTLWVWLVPFVLIGVAGTVLVLVARRARRVPADVLDDAEENRVRALLAEHHGSASR